MPCDEVGSLQALAQVAAHRGVIAHLGHRHALAAQVLEFGCVVFDKVLDRNVWNVVGPA